jgi:CHASE2 domain-containing sensor protein
MLDEPSRKIIYNVLWSPGWLLGVVMTAVGAAGFIGGILTWQEHGAHYVVIGSLFFLIPGIVICAAVVHQAKKQP